MKSIFLALIAILLLVGCSDDHKSNTGPEITPDHVIIQGVITDTTTDSIHYLTGVAVKLIYDTTILEQTSSDSGKFSFSIHRQIFENLDSIRLQLVKKNYRSIDTVIGCSLLIIDSSFQSNILRLSMTSSMILSISGHVIDKTSSEKIPNVSITLTHNDTTLWQQTNEFGSFNFSIKSTKLDVSKPFLFTIIKDGYDTLAQSITVTNVQQLLGLQFSLEKVLLYENLTITGKVFENDSGKLNALSHATITLLYDNSSRQTESEDDGYFHFISTNHLKKNRILRLVVNKELYKDLDTTINIDTIGIENLQSSSNLSLIMNYEDGVTKVNFFPVQIGTIWEYRITLQSGFMEYTKTTTGIERWEIISIDEGNNTFKMKSTFNGTIRHCSAMTCDTTHYTDINNIMTLSMESGYLKLIGYEIRNDIFRPSIPYSVNFIQPYRKGIDTNIKTGNSRSDQLYTLRYGVGLISLITQYRNIPDWETNSCNLISFNGNPVESGK